MALTIHDPGRIGLRRGIRAAIAMPVVLAITLFLLDDRVGAVYAGFGTAGLLITADYAGSWRRRLASYLLTGVAGTIVLVIGWAAAQSTVSAVVVTAVIGFVLAFVSLLRGLLAVGSPAVLLIFVVAVTIGGPERVVTSDIAAWWVAVIVSTITALVILPHDVRSDIRDALGDAFAATAEVADSVSHEGGRSADYDARVETATRDLGRLNATYDGKPFRPTGASRHDQALTLLVSVINNAWLLLIGTAGVPRRRQPASPIAGRSAMSDALTQMLRDLARTVRDRTFVPSAAALDEARDVHQEATDAWVLASTRAGERADVIAEVVADDHVLRMAAVMAEQMASLGRELNGAPPEDLDAEPPIPQRPLRTVILAHLSVRSPWLRNAIRTGIGLSVAVLIVKLTGVQHGFWVLLGVLSVLRYDLTATARTAWLAIVGTLIGVAAGTGVILLVGPHSLVLWALLPLAVFLAAWAPVALNYPIGQGAFSMFILLVLGIIDWPPHLLTGLVRIEDILIGVGVAIVVGLLMWPRGAVGALHLEVADGLRQCAAFLSLATRGLCDVVEPAHLAKAHTDARTAAERASETYDMAIMQRGAAGNVGAEWASLTTTSHLLLAVGRIVGALAVRPPRLAGNATNVSAVSEARLASDARWAAVADQVEQTGRAPAAPATEQLPPIPRPHGVTDLVTAHDFVITVWVVDWVVHLNRLSGREAVPAAVGQHAS